MAVYGPVAATASHPDAEPVGWRAFHEAIASTPVPVYALGGMTPADLEAAMRSGAHGIAMQRAAWPD
jgi:thiamine monophosphate synthase